MLKISKKKKKKTLIILTVMRKMKLTAISIYKWCRIDGKVQKAELKIQVGEAVDVWNIKVKELKQNIYRKRKQVNKDLLENYLLSSAD